MPKTAVATKVHKPFNVHRHVGPQFALDLVFAVNDLADIVDLGFGKIVRTGIRINIEFA